MQVRFLPAGPRKQCDEAREDRERQELERKLFEAYAEPKGYNLTRIAINKFDVSKPSPGPCAFETHRYGLANVLLDRDGRVLGTHLRHGNGPLMAEAPAMADLLCDLLAGVPTEQLRPRAASIMREIERHCVREPGEDDE